jgi:ribosomal-protein-alanine N-acetyltransferase
LRHAIDSDLDAILALERATEHAPHWSPSTYIRILDSADPRRCLIVALAERSLVGFAVGLMEPTALNSAACIAELETVVVDIGVRRAGIGQALCLATFDWCRSHGATEIVLEVRAASDGAIALYAGLGFAQTGRRPRYYRNPDDDAILMRLPLVSSATLKESSQT